MSHDVAQRHLTILIKDISRPSHNVVRLSRNVVSCSCNGRLLNLGFYSWWSHRPLRRHTTTHDGWLLGDRGPSVVNRATLHDVAVVGVNLLSMSWQFLVMFKNVLRFSLMWCILRWSCDVVRRHTTSCDAEVHPTIFVQWPCDDVVRLHLVLYDVVRLHLGSYNSARPSYDRRTTSLRLPTISQTLPASQAHRFQCDHKTKIVISIKISQPSWGFFLEIYDVTHRTTSQLSVAPGCDQGFSETGRTSSTEYPDSCWEKRSGRFLPLSDHPHMALAEQFIIWSNIPQLNIS